MYTMGLSRKIPIKDLMGSAGASINAIRLLILITGGGGAFKQVIIDGGVGKYIADIFAGVSISPLLLAWIVAVILRICLGSGTVAALSTAGLVLPMLEAYPDANLSLVAPATGAGTAFISIFFFSKNNFYFAHLLTDTILELPILDCLLR